MLTLPDQATQLATRIIQSATLDDERRLDTAIREALDSYRLADAMEYVFDPVIACLDGPARRRASVAIGGHLADAPPSTGRRVPRRSRRDLQRAGNVPGTPHTRLLRVLCTGNV